MADHLELRADGGALAHASEAEAAAARRENAMSLEVPGPVATYLAAEKAKNSDLLALCFAEDALVHDEGRDYRGRDAIKSWKQEADAKYQYVMEPLAASV